jgi:hypothetical protein
MPPATRRRQQLQAAGAKPPRPPPSTRDYLRVAVLQHGGLALAAAGIALLCTGYDAGWMHNTHLCLLSLLLCLLGLFMHETRPVKADERYQQQLAGTWAPSGGGGGGNNNATHED